MPRAVGAAPERKNLDEAGSQRSTRACQQPKAGLESRCSQKSLGSTSPEGALWVKGGLQSDLAVLPTLFWSWRFSKFVSIIKALKRPAAK